MPAKKAPGRAKKPERPEDEGPTQYLVGVDLEHQVVYFKFEKAVEWLGFDEEQTEHLIRDLQEGLDTLRKSQIPPENPS